MPLVQYLAAGVALCGLYGVRRRVVWGPLVCGLGSSLWVAYGAFTGQYGLCAAECVYLGSYVLMAAAWQKETPRP